MLPVLEFNINGRRRYVLFGVWLLSFHIMRLSSMPVVRVAVVWVLLLPSSTPLRKHTGLCVPLLLLAGVGGFRLGAVVSNTAVHILVRGVWWTQQALLFSVSPGAELLGHRTGVCSALVDSPKQFSAGCIITPCQQYVRETRGPRPHQHLLSPAMAFAPDLLVEWLPLSSIIQPGFSLPL